MVSDLTDLGPLGTSDHHAMLWKLPVSHILIESKRSVYDYSKADIEAIRQYLRMVNWEDILVQPSIEENWIPFSRVLLDVESKYVPLKKMHSGKPKPMWMTYKAVRAVEHKHRVYQKYRNNAHPACVKANRLASKAVRESRRSFEFKLARNIRHAKKSFFAYARSKTRCKVKVGPVLDDNGKLVTDSSEMAEVFNKQFSSVFTAEDVSNIPAAEKFFKGPSEEKLVDIKITAQLVRKKLQELRAD